MWVEIIKETCMNALGRRLSYECRPGLNREKRSEHPLGGGNTLSKTTETGRSMGLLDRGGHNLPVQEEKRFRNKGSKRCTVESIRPKYLLSQE